MTYCYDVNDKCESIKNSTSNIKTIVENLSYEQSISESELINLLSSLEQIDWDLTGALKILEDS
jgi:exonuclease VII small subunit